MEQSQEARTRPDSNKEAKIRRERANLQLEIVQGILENGLVSAAHQRTERRIPITSYGSSYPEIYGCPILKEGLAAITSIEERPELNRRDVHWQVGELKGFEDVSIEAKSIADYTIIRALYSNIYSIFPVIAERHRESKLRVKDLSKETLETRLANSMLIVVPLDENVDISNLSRWEASLKSPISPDKISAILLPSRVKTKLVTRLSKTEIPLIGVGDKIQKHYFGGKRERVLKVPDYETELRKLIEKSDVPLFIHGVRLPIEEDIPHLLEAKSFKES